MSIIKFLQTDRRRYMTFLVFSLFLMTLGADGSRADSVVEVDSLEELVGYASQSGVSVKLKPGSYTFDRDTTGELLELPRYRNGELSGTLPAATLLHFSGNRSTYDLTGSMIKIDTHLHQAFGSRKIFEALVSGNGNTIKGLTLHDDGDHAPINSAIMLYVLGNQNVITDADLYIHGSYPYGYGHLLGKGGPPNIVNPRKHSGLLISGKKNQLLSSKVVQHAYGHGIVLQGAVDTLIKDCYVEGEMRTTDEMLAETQGPAFETGFKSIYPPGEIVPGQIKSLAEDGIRTYRWGPHVPYRTARVTVIDCTIKNMRAGVSIGSEQGPSKIINTTAIGYQERGFCIGSNGIIENCRGDAMYGPLLTFIGRNTKNCTIDLSLIDTVSDFPVRRLLEINGSGHKITLRNHEDKPRSISTPIVFGESDWGDIHLFRKPESDPRTYSGAKDCTLINHTAMPIIFSELSSGSKVITRGEIIRDDGQGNQYKVKP